MRARAAERRMRIESVLWDETAGLYFDYDAARDTPQSVPVRDDVLAALGRDRVARARAPGARQPARSSSGRAGS